MGKKHDEFLPLQQIREASNASGVVRISVAIVVPIVFALALVALADVFRNAYVDLVIGWTYMFSVGFVISLTGAWRVRNPERK